VPRRSKQQPTKSIKSTEQTELTFAASENETYGGARSAHRDAVVISYWWD